MSLKLPDSVSSVQDVKALVLEVKAYSKWFAHNGIKKKLGAGKAGEAPVISEAAAGLIRAAAGKELTSQAIDELIEELEVFADEAPSITVTLAAAPSNGLKKTIVAWFRTNVRPDLLISFDFNSTLLGGMVVRTGSHIFDWSFRRQIIADGGNFTEVLRRV